MASFSTSQYGKIASFQNNSGSADAAAPEGGVYLFASGTVGSSKLYLQNEGESSLIDLDSLLDIAGDSGTGTVSNSQTLTIAGGTGLDTAVSGQTVTFTMDLNELTAAAVDASADSIAIIDATDDGSKKESIADLATAMAGDGLVASAGAFAVNVADMATSMTGDLADSDEFAISDGGTMKKVDFSVVRDAAFADLSGDATVAAGGALTIAANAVQTGMVHDDVATELAGDGLVASSGVLAVNVADMGTSLTGAIDDTDEFAISDAGTMKKVDFSVVRDAVFADLSGDATVAAGGALTIAANAVQTGMVHDDVATELAGDGLAASSGVLAVQASGSIVLASDKLGLSGSIAGAGLSYAGGVNSISSLALDIDELAALGGTGIDQGDHLLFSDAGTEKKITFSNFEDAIFGNFGGDLAVAAGGAATIQADAVEGSMLNDNVISGQTELAHADIVDADELMVSDGGTLKKVGLDSLQNHYFAAVSGDATVADGGALTIAANAVQTGMVHDDVATELAGAGLAAASGVLAVGVDDSSLEINSDALRVKASGITSAMILDGAILNADVNDSAAIALNKIDGNVDMGGNFALGNQANDVCQITGPIKLAANSILDSGNNGAITFDGSGNTQAAGTLTVGTDGGGTQFTVHGASANEFMRYIPGDNLLKFQNASSATILTLGGDATSEYALDVTNGANNQNKVRASAFVTYSDESLKCEIQTMNNALDTVMSLNGVEFTWNDSGERDFGFIAQDVQNVLPKAVHVAADGVQGVDYSRLTSVLVEAVKAQQIQINDLKKALKN
jgi:hypothetical protein